jgi:hypothetical protein
MSMIKEPVVLTDRDICRIRLAVWFAFMSNAWPDLGISPNPFTEISIDEDDKRLYIIDNGTRRLVGPRRARKVNRV